MGLLSEKQMQLKDYILVHIVCQYDHQKCPYIVDGLSERNTQPRTPKRGAGRQGVLADSVWSLTINLLKI